MLDQSYVTKCRNCGHEVILDGGDPEEKCYFCHRPALKKESKNMPEKEKNEAKIKSPDVKTLSPVPPKPDTSGENNFQARLALHDYYEANAPAILADYKSLGDTPTRKRWGFSHCGWGTFRLRHGLPIGKPVKVAEKINQNVDLKDAKPPAKEQPSESPQEIYCPSKLCKSCELFIEYRGYRQAIRDMVGGHHA